MQSGLDSVRVREARVEDALAITEVNIRSWQTAYRDILPDSFLDALAPEARVDRWREALQPSMEGRFTFVAEVAPSRTSNEGQIVGFASGGPERDGISAGGVVYQGEIYALYLLAEHRRQGLGCRLVAAATQRLIHNGATSVVIWALKDNGPARTFYEKLGGTLIGEKPVTIGPSNLVDVAYGWPNARDLLIVAQGTAS